MVRFGDREIAKEKFMLQKCLQRPAVTPKLVKAKTNSKHLIGYSDNTIRPLVLIMPKMSGYVKTLKIEDKCSKLMSFRIDDEKLLEKYKAIWTKFEDLKNIKLNTLPVFDDRYLKTKIFEIC